MAVAGTNEDPRSTWRRLVLAVAEAQEVAREIAARSPRRLAAPVRAGFVIADPQRPEVAPPLSRLLRGGRGGEVKIKVLLSVLWSAVAEPYDVRDRPAKVWAELVGLQEPGTRGAHRVNGALRELARQQFLTTQLQPGAPSTVTLLDERGNGVRYQPPGRRFVQLRDAGEDSGEHRYFQVPTEFWTNGWIAALGGPAVAMFLVLLSHASGRSPANIWFSPAVADARYALSEDTRTRGIRQLEAFGLVRVLRRPISRSRLDVTRLRNTYTVDFDRLRDGDPMTPRSVDAVLEQRMPVPG